MFSDLPTAIVVGDYLYFDGGELYYNESGTVAVYPGSLPSLRLDTRHTMEVLTRAQRTPPTPSI
jgi:hypothetical protein